MAKLSTLENHQNFLHSQSKLKASLLLQQHFLNMFSLRNFNPMFEAKNLGASLALGVFWEMVNCYTVFPQTHAHDILPKSHP